jgi:AcrR family transcriptional regulator
MSRPVKTPRAYDATGRRLRAEERRQAILDAAERAFLSDGYAATSVPAIAAAAGVSVETIYKAFGPKAALAKALWLRALDGQGPVAAPQRSDALAGTAPTAHALIEGWTAFIREVTPRLAPVALLVSAAASHDADMASLHQSIEDERRQRMSLNAARLADRGWLKSSVTHDVATDILWTFLSPRIYEALVIRSGWTVDAYADFIRNGLVGALLPTDVPSG